jgi:hypothetical protein
MRRLAIGTAVVFITSLGTIVPKMGIAQTREIKDCTAYDGDKFKVVPKDQDCGTKETPAPAPKPKPKPKPKPPKPKPKPCPVCPPAQTQVIEKEKVVEKVTYKPWRIYGLAGYGQDGLKTKTRSEGEQVNKYYGAVFGAGIDYNVNESLSVGVQGLSNETGLFSVGYSFGSK